MGTGVGRGGGTGPGREYFRNFPGDFPGISGYPRTGNRIRLGVESHIGTVSDDDMITNFAEIHAALEVLWTGAVDAQQSCRQQNARGRPTRPLSRVNIGDFVLVALKERRSKVSMTWSGP